MVLNGKTPYEILYGHRPSYEHLRVFGSLCYAHNQRRLGEKFTSRSRKCIFVGYPYGKKGWRLYDSETQQLFVSRDVVFYENVFPFASSLPTPSTMDHMADGGEDGSWELANADMEARGGTVDAIAALDMPLVEWANDAQLSSNPLDVSDVYGPGSKAPHVDSVVQLEEASMGLSEIPRNAAVGPGGADSTGPSGDGAPRPCGPA